MIARVRSGLADHIWQWLADSAVVGFEWSKRINPVIGVDTMTVKALH